MINALKTKVRAMLERGDLVPICLIYDLISQGVDYSAMERQYAA